jgi:hypothetical protein
MKTNFMFFMLVLVLQSCIAQTKKGFNLENSIIPISEIMDGGPPKDGIPSIDNPKFMKVSETKLDNEDRILGVFENGIAKAYPIMILNYHEIVNDYFGNKPVVITFCPLCGSGIAFNAEIKGNPTSFGVSGLLYNSDVLLYDRETESLWSQLLFKAVSGSLVNTELQVLVTANTTWGSWLKKHPNSVVLSEETGYKRDYSINPYPDYSKSSSLYFPVAEEDERFHPKEMVIGLEILGKFKAYPFSELKKLKSIVLNDTFQGKKVVINYDSKSDSAEITDEEGNIIPAVTNFWFAWIAFHPEAEVYFNN